MSYWCSEYGLRVFGIKAMGVWNMGYGCSEYRLRVSESSVLRKIFGHMWGEVTRTWKRLHNEELHDLYDLYSSDVIRSIKSI